MNNEYVTITVERHLNNNNIRVSQTITANSMEDKILEDLTVKVIRSLRKDLEIGLKDFACKVAGQ